MSVSLVRSGSSLVINKSSSTAFILESYRNLLVLKFIFFCLERKKVLFWKTSQSNKKLTTKNIFIQVENILLKICYCFNCLCLIGTLWYGGLWSIDDYVLLKTSQPGFLLLTTENTICFSLDLRSCPLNPCQLVIRSPVK